MKKERFISCIILSCDSHKDKGNSVFHSVCSVLQQNYGNFEIILVENSHYRTQDFLSLTTNKINKWNRARDKPIKVITIINKTSVSRGHARNIGVKESKGEIIVFLDDDTIIMNQESLSVINKYSTQYDYGYGAKRYWTINNKFQKKSKEVLKVLEKRDYSLLRNMLSGPPPSIRGSKEIDIQKVSLIANFGFCKRKAFKKVGGFPDFQGYGFEDDYLMFCLYEKGYKYIFLDELEVAHITHTITDLDKKNLLPYFTKLIKQGYYWFHVVLTFTKTPPVRGKVLEKLQTLHCDYRVENAYSTYKKSQPLDLETLNQKQRDCWKEKIRISRIDFFRLLYQLQAAKNLDQFIQSSMADFDNLAPVLHSAIKNNIISISEKGDIKKSFSFNFTISQDKNITNHCDTQVRPNRELNQFPCDIFSRKRRVLFLKSRYPFAEYLRFAIIGDDDLLSLEMLNEYWAWPVIIEKDLRIIELIRKQAPRFDIKEFDITNITSEKVSLPEIQTFITDPPYTFHGVLCFIIMGLRMLVKDNTAKELYVIMNPTMMGSYFFDLQLTLNKAGVYLTEVINNFSQYKLPLHYKEHDRARAFQSDFRLNNQAISYSSSSNLYIYRTLTPDINHLLSIVDTNKLYQHYL